MSKISLEFPFLNHLGDQSRLVESPFFQKTGANCLKFINEHRENLNATYKGYVICFGQDDDDYRFELLPVMDIIIENWARMMSRFRANVALVSGAFMAAGKEAAEAFEKDPVTTSSYLAGKTFSGTVLESLRHNTIGYSLQYDEQGALKDYCILWLDNFGTIYGFFAPRIQFMSRSVVVNDKNEMVPNPMLLLGDYPLQRLSEGVIDTVQSFLLFCHYAEITDEFVARPGSRQAREQAGSGETTVNDTRYNVRRLSVTYFKNICRDESFPVRGHFRMQAYGAGRTRRKLIYVDSFVKHGYHRRATKLTVGEFDKGSMLGK